jgi:CheY-like chemotaxis protein
MYFQDDGRGMSETELDSLFQEFEQVLDDEETQPTSLCEEGDSRGFVALGLGLAMTARFVRLNCGQITIASEEKKGTRVSVKIPFRMARPEPIRRQTDMSETLLPTPPLLTPDHPPRVHPLKATPGLLERSISLDNILPIRHPMNSHRDYSLTPGPESLASVAQAVAMTTAPTFDPSTGRFPFPIVNPTSSRVSILIAEDNPLNSRLLETRLTRRGHGVKVTADGQACAETFKTSPDGYDIILMDLQVYTSQAEARA